MRATLALLWLAAGLASAAAQGVSPFLPAPAPSAKILKVLTPPDFLDRAVVEGLEGDLKIAVALDTYASAAELAERNAAERYDLVILNGPALARRLAGRRLARLDFRKLPNARRVQPVVAAKYAAYDREGAYGVPFGWSAFGLIYDEDKAREALGGPPVSFAQALGLARDARRGSVCAVVWPDAPEESFLAVWRLTGVDPARAKLADVKSAAAVLERARGAALAFAAPDEVGAFAKGAACLGAGTAGEAAAVNARGGETVATVRFAYPREGALATLYAFALPADAAAPDASYRLLDALLAPERAARDATSAGVNGAEDAGEIDELRRLAPAPALDPALVAAMQAEWKRLAAAR